MPLTPHNRSGEFRTRAVKSSERLKTKKKDMSWLSNNSGGALVAPAEYMGPKPKAKHKAGKPKAPKLKIKSFEERFKRG